MFQMIQSDINQYLAKPSSKELRNQVEEDIRYLYKEEFNDSIEKIFIDNESLFMTSFKSKTIKILKALLPSEIWEDESFQVIIKNSEQETYSTLYKKVYTQLQEEYEAFSKTNPKKYLASFINHCESNTTPFHNCYNKGLFIPIKANDKVEYVICNECKMCYNYNMITMQCESCDRIFYSSYISPLDKAMPPATWKMYHCDIILNEQMKCIKCDDLFWLKGEELHCRKCKFLINPLEVAWKCVNCNKEFRAKAKVYNPLKHQIIKKATKQALINKEIVTPRELPCNCVNNILDVEFVHNDRCDGRLYLGELYRKLILVCSKCCVFSSLNKYEWRCPLCNKAFYTIDIAKVIENEEEDNNKKTPRLVINLGKSEEIEDSKMIKDDKEGKNKEKQKDKDKDNEIKKEYNIFYGNENQGYHENSLLIRPEKEEIFDKLEIMKRVKNNQEDIKDINENRKEVDVMDMHKENKINDDNTITVTSTSAPSSSAKFINFSMDNITIVSKENEVLSHVTYSNKDYSLLIVPFSVEVNKLLQNYKAMKNLINVYGYVQEEDTLNILIEKIDNTLFKEITTRAQKEEKKLFKEVELMEMISQCINPIQQYSSFISSDRFIMLQDHLIKWKFSPFPTDENSTQFTASKKKASSIHSFALMMVYAASLNKDTVNDCINIITNQTDENLIKYIMSSFRGKYSEFFCELLSKLLKYKSTITFQQLDQILNE